MIPYPQCESVVGKGKECHTNDLKEVPCGRGGSKVTKDLFNHYAPNFVPLA